MGEFPNKETQFSSANQPVNNGRPKKIYTIIKELGYSADDMKSAFNEVAWYDIVELKNIYSDESKPIILRIIANQFYNALEKSDWSKIKEILEHVIGRPQQSIDHTTKGESMNSQYNDLSVEELEQKLNELRKPVKK